MRTLGPTSTRQPDDWRSRAVCRPGDMDLTGSAKEQRLAVERICRGRHCPVIAECYEDGVASEGVGAWGATTQADREAAGVRPPERDGCGSVAGYSAHRRHKERPCSICKTAWYEYQWARTLAARATA